MDALDNRLSALELAVRLQEHRLEQLEAEKIAVRLNTLEVTVENMNENVRKMQEISEKLEKNVASIGAQIKAFMWIVGSLLTLATILAPVWIK